MIGKLSAKQNPNQLAAIFLNILMNSIEGVPFQLTITIARRPSCLYFNSREVLIAKNINYPHGADLAHDQKDARIQCFTKVIISYERAGA